MGEIVTFYSYKGGVGRSMALANAATLLARWGYNVLIIDWDLEAPGLENFFKNYFNLDGVAEQKGIVDLLSMAYNAASDGSAIGALKNREARPDSKAAADESKAEGTLSWKECLVTVKLRESGKTLHLLTAGQRDSEYFTRVRSFDVKEFYREKRGGFFIEALRREWKKTYDFVLVDSRTGVTDIGGICTIQLPDILVLLFTATDQGLKGAVDVANKATLERQGLPFDRLKLLAIPIPSRFDTSVEHDLSQEWLDRFEEKAAVLYGDWLPRDVRRREILEKTKLPYRPYFSFGEKLAVIEEGTVDPAGIGYAYETLTALIANKLENARLLREDRDSFVKKAAGAKAQATPEPEIAKPSVSEKLNQHQLWLESGGTSGQRADFSKENLRVANFAYAHLDEARFSEANLNAAYFLEADISRADFSSASLQGAILQEAWGESVNFQNANLIDANLRDVKLVRANFNLANLQGAELVNADLRDANFEDANLARANLKNAQLREAILENATLTDVAGLTLSQLGGANLAGAKLSESIVESAELGKLSLLLNSVRMMLYAQVALCFYGFYLLLGASDAQLVANSSVPNLGLGIASNNLFKAIPVGLALLYISLHLNMQNLWERLAKLPAVFPDGKTLDEAAPSWFISIMVRSHFKLLRENTMSTGGRLFFIFIAWWIVPPVLFLFWLRYLPLRDWTGTGLHIVVVTFSVWAGIQFYRLALRTLRGEGSSIRHSASTEKRGALDLKLMPGKPDVKRKSFAAEMFQQHRSVLTSLFAGAALLASSIIAFNGSQFSLDLRGANLAGAQLSNKDIRYARMQAANLRGASLFGANLQGVNLTDAQLLDADLRQASFNGAVLQNSNLSGADLSGANLYGAASLTREQISAAITSETTTFPGYLPKPFPTPTPDLRPEALAQYEFAPLVNIIIDYLPYKVALTPDGKTIFSVGRLESVIHRWNVLDDGTVNGLPPMQGHTKDGRSVSVSPDGKVVASGSDDGQIRLWRIDEVNPFATLTPAQGEGYVFNAEFSKDGKTLVSASQSLPGKVKTVRVWNLDDMTSVSSIRIGATEIILDIDVDRKLMAVMTPPIQGAQLRSITDNSFVRLLEGSQQQITSGAFSSDGQLVALGVTAAGNAPGSTTGAVAILLLSTSYGRVISSPLIGPKGNVISLSFSPDGQLVAAGLQDGSIQFWRVSDGLPLPTLPGQQSRAIQNIAFSSDGRTFTAAGANSSIRVWRIIRSE